MSKNKSKKVKQMATTVIYPSAGIKAEPVAIKRTEVKIAHKPKIILSENFINQVNFLHANVKQGLEWSGVLVYSNKEGNVDTPENWVIDIEEVILMDIGSPGYTEYDMDVTDTYSADKWMDALEVNKQLGHKMNVSL